MRYAPHNFIHFNPRSPRGGATHIVYLPFYLLRFQSTLPTRGSDVLGRVTEMRTGISIHAPHEGERQQRIIYARYEVHISIHAPHEGERQVADAAVMLVVVISIHAPHEGERHT